MLLPKGTAFPAPDLLCTQAQLFLFCRDSYQLDKTINTSGCPAMRPLFFLLVAFGAGRWEIPHQPCLHLGLTFSSSTKIKARISGSITLLSTKPLAGRCLFALILAPQWKSHKHNQKRHLKLGWLQPNKAKKNESFEYCVTCSAVFWWWIF